MVAGSPITTRVMLEERPTFTRLSLRVTADHGVTSVRGYVGAGHAQPPFLKALRSDITPSWLGGPLTTHPIRPGDVADFVQSVLDVSTRDVPAVVLAPLEKGGYVVDPADLAWDLLGRAKLHVITDHRATFELSDTVGDRRMSCYWGAARAYMPGWSRHDDPLEHPLLVRDRLDDPMLRSTWLGELGIWTGTRLTLPPSLAERRPTPSTDPTGAADAVDDRGSRRGASPKSLPPGRQGEPETVASADQTSRPAAETRPEDRTAVPAGAPAPPAADVAPLFERLFAELRGLGELVDTVLSTNQDLRDEIQRLRTISAVRSSSTNAIERRLGRLEEILEEAFPDGSPEGRPAPPDPGAPGPDDDAGRTDTEEDEGRLTLADVVKEMAESHADALVFLDSAHAAAEQSPYEDPERVRAILDAMAHVARRRRDGMLGTSLREAFGDLGIDYRGTIARSTPDRLRQQYVFHMPDGEPFEAVEHIVLGNTYDPRRCLRIYLSSRVSSEPRFVIGHVGRHFEVMTSN
jgi:hypothetical protein